MVVWRALRRRSRRSYSRISRKRPKRRYLRKKVIEEVQEEAMAKV